MVYDFDEVIDRRGSGCVRFDRLKDEFGRDDLLPMWIADMDFRTPDFIVNAISERLQHPVFGYTSVPDGYFEMISEWVGKTHGWNVDCSHIRYIPGIVKGIGMVIDAFLKEGEKIVIQPPVYHPFRMVPNRKHHPVVFNPLRPVYEDGIGNNSDILTTDRDRRLLRYEMDLESLEKLFRNDQKIKMLILSNPHNPAGICWERETLEKLALLADRYNILVVSDEIHAEMALHGKRHIPFASVSSEASAHSITFMAPSKTFNIAGIVSSYALVPDDKLRSVFFDYLEAGELNSPSLFAPIATMAAYRNGEEWRRQMLEYVWDNVRFTDEWLRENLPQIRCVVPDASFLIWLDCRSLGLSQEELTDLFVNRAHLAMNDGSMFGSVLPDGSNAGPEGIGFMRMNVGCPRSTVKKALQLLKAAVSEYVKDK